MDNDQIHSDDREDDESDDEEEDDDDDDEEEEEIGYDEEPWRPAVKTFNVQQLKDLIQERGIEVLKQNHMRDGKYTETTALLTAAYGNDLAMVQYLLGDEQCRSVVDINAVDRRFSWTALHFAAKNGHVPMVQYLIGQGMDVNINPRQGNCYSTPLYVAALHNKTRAFQCLLETPGCEVDQDEDKVKTLLSSLVAHANLPMMQCLMEHYTRTGNMERATSESRLAIHLVCGMRKRRWDLEVVKYLVETFHVDLESILDNDNKVEDEDDSSEDDEMDDNTKATPLLKACRSGNFDITQYLVSRGAKMDAKDKNGDSVLHLSVTKLDMVQYFVETHGIIDVEQPNRKGNTVLHYACRRGSAETVRYLVQVRNANVNAVNIYGETTLHMASHKGCLKAAQCIVESGRCTTINAQDNDGQTPLHISCAMHNVGFHLTRYWVDTTHANIMVRDKDGKTSLHFAAKGRYGRHTVFFLVTRMPAIGFDEHASVGQGLSKRQKSSVHEVN